MSGYQEKRFDSEGAISGPQDTIMKQVSDSMSAYVDCEGNASQVPIALCGFGLRLPGGICNGQGFWQLIVNGRDARDLGASSSYFLDGDDLASFDSSMAIYNGGGEELELDCSPQERKILEIVRECLEDACEINYRAVDARVECYINSYTQGSRSIANCVSREYDFQGPRLVTGSASASLSEACHALHSGAANAAIVAGVNLFSNVSSPPSTVDSFSAEALSAVYKCHQ